MEPRVKIPRREDAEAVLAIILLEHETTVARNNQMTFSENKKEYFTWIPAQSSQNYKNMQNTKMWLTAIFNRRIEKTMLVTFIE